MLVPARTPINGEPQPECISVRNICLQWCYHVTCAKGDNTNPVFAEYISLRKVPGFTKLRQKNSCCYSLSQYVTCLEQTAGWISEANSGVSIVLLDFVAGPKTDELRKFLEITWHWISWNLRVTLYDSKVKSWRMGWARRWDRIQRERNSYKLLQRNLLKNRYFGLPKIPYYLFVIYFTALSSVKWGLSGRNNWVFVNYKLVRQWKERTMTKVIHPGICPRQRRKPQRSQVSRCSGRNSNRVPSECVISPAEPHGLVSEEEMGRTSRWS
jgi:hypothetical protein